MQHCDVLIVGAGPAGSSCARDLVRAGIDVLVIDKARFPRDKVCAGWITPAVVETLGLDLADYARTHTLQAFHGFRTRAIGHREVRTDYRRAISYGIRRCELDHYLVARSGARLLDGEPVARLDGGPGRWVVNGRIEAALLVGAGGHFCPVAQRLNPHKDGGAVVAAQEAEVRLTATQRRACRIEGEMPALYFCPDRQGYGWAVRKGDFLNLGFGRLLDDGAALPAQVRAFRMCLDSVTGVSGDLSDPWKGHAYRLYGRPQRRLAGDGALLVGDAAGLAYPVSGEGILTAVESGRLAARAIVAASNHAFGDAPATYAASVLERYGRPAALDDAPWLPAAWASWLGVRLLETPWFTRHVLLDRWFLHSGQPALR
jgi:menaquinone-9 beta-reductase